MNKLTCLIFVAMATHLCSAIDPFARGIPQGKVTASALDETSGLAFSRVHSGVLYTQNDKGDSSHFFAVDIKSGNLLATFEVKSAQNYDWEDLAYGPCIDDCAKSPCSASTRPSRYCIYIADIGDHGGDGPKDIIYMVREPTSISDSDISVVDTFQFSWAEFDAETLMISPDGRLFIISKVDGGRGIMAELPRSGWGQGRVALDMGNTATLKLSTTKNDPQGGDISPDGKEMVIVAEQGAYYFSVPDGDYLKAVRTNVPTRISNYQAVPSTEAIAWNADSTGFYVLAEGNDQTIYYYPKLSNIPPVG